MGKVAAEVAGGGDCPFAVVECDFVSDLGIDPLVAAAVSAGTVGFYSAPEGKGGEGEKS